MRRGILIDPSAAEAMSCAASQSLPHETGGILVGHYEDKSLVVTHAIVIQADVLSRDRYTRDDLQANAALKMYLQGREQEDPGGYLGEWHSHPGPSGISSIDTSAIRGLAKEVDTDIALIIISPRQGDRLAGALTSRNRKGRITSSRAVITMIPSTH